MYRLELAVLPSAGPAFARVKGGLEKSFRPSLSRRLHAMPRHASKYDEDDMYDEWDDDDDEDAQWEARCDRHLCARRVSAALLPLEC